MTPSKREAQQDRASAPHGRPDLGSLFALWSSHPDDSIRAHAADFLDEVVEAAEPEHEREAVEATLRAARGTPLEPFRLSDWQLDAAVQFLRLGFSRAYRRSAIRVVSNDTIGRAGGLLIDRDLKPTFFARQGVETDVATPWKYWSFVPGELPDANPTEALVGTCHLADGRLTILELDVASVWPDRGRPGHSSFLPSSLLAGKSRLGGSRLRALGVAVDLVDGDRLRVTAASPESLIRAVSALGQAGLLRLARHKGRVPVVYALPPATPPEIPTPVPVLTSREAPFPWMSCSATTTPPAALVYAAFRWGMAPSRWLDTLSPEQQREAIQGR